MLVGHEGPDGRGGACWPASICAASSSRWKERKPGTHPAGSCQALRLLGELRLGVVPGGRVRSPDMDLRPVGHRGVEAAQSQQHDGLRRALGHEVRAAPASEAAELAGRGFERAEQRWPRTRGNFSRGTALTDEKAAPWVLRQLRQWQCTMRVERCVGLIGDVAAQQLPVSISARPSPLPGRNIGRRLRR